MTLHRAASSSLAAAPGIAQPAPVGPFSPPPAQNELAALGVLVGATGVLLLYLAKIRRDMLRAIKASERAVDDAFSRLKFDVESVALEVERIAESQRYVTAVVSRGRQPVTREEFRAPRNPAPVDALAK